MNKIFLYTIMVFLFITMSPGIMAQDPTFLSRSAYGILTNIDDAEESEYGVLDFESSDLELVDEFSKQVVGLRFTNVDLPRNTKISGAYLQFTVDEVSTGTCNLNISGELSGNAGPFEGSKFNISSRVPTVNAVPWTPAAWNVENESGEAQRSADISPVIQEILKQDEWNSGNSMVMIITGSGTRTAISHNKNPELSPRLIIETESPVVDVPVEQVFINEIMAKNSSVFDDYGESDDWIELYNANSFPVYMGGVFLSDDVEDPLKWQLLNPLTIDAGGFALIWADKDTLQGSLHASFKLSSSGETIILSQVFNDQIFEIDRVSYDTIPENVSYARKNDGTDNWLLLQASPGSSNNESKPVLTAPSVSLESGIFENRKYVSLSAGSPDVDIYYTLNGDVPNSGSKRYINPIEIDTTTLLKLMAYKEGFAQSSITERFYLFDHHSDLPVFNISTDPDNLWDDYTGIYVEGKNGTTHHNYDIPSNFFQPWERPATITMLEPDGSLAFCEKAGIELSGNDSKKFVQKSFNLHFRKKYGTNGVDYQVFRGLDITEFKHLKLRNSGQDFNSMMMRDGLNHTILQGVVDVDVMACRPAVLYLNGEYWGLYNLRESLTDDYIDTHFDVEKSEIDLLTRDGSNSIRIDAGTDADYNDLYSYMENKSMSEEGNYRAVADRLDMNEFLNYQIAEIYFANFDWPDNNQKMWRAGTDHKWRWMLYDTDASTNFSIWGDGIASFNALQHATDPYSSSWPNNAKSSLIFRGLLQNDIFKQEFVQRTCTYMALVFNQERVHAITDSLVNLVDGEMDREIEKWTRDYTGFGIGLVCGGSRKVWESYVEDYKDFFTDRPGYMMQHLKAKFDNYNTYQLRFNYNEGTEGRLYVNSNEFKVPYDYTAEYFSGYGLEVKAVADSAYVFVKWAETGETSPTITFTGEHASVLTPVFALKGTVGEIDRLKTSQVQMTLYPNPASTETVHVIISGLTGGEKLELSVYNMMGQQTEHLFLHGTREILNIDIPVSDWKSGVYLVKVQGHSVQKTMKLIVE